MKSPLYTKTIICQSGERFPMLIERESGVPLFSPTVYLTTMLRGKGNQAATLDVHLRAIKFLYIWGIKQKIDIDGRFKSGDFLKLHEIDSLAVDVRTRADSLLKDSDEDEQSTVKKRRSKVAYLEHYRKQGNKEESDSQVEGETAATRFRYIREYVDWLALQKLSRITPSSEKYIAMAHEHTQMKNAFNARIPAGGGHNDFRKKLGITLEQQKRLLEVIKPQSPENPWRDERIRVRNQVLIHMLLFLGIRKGEALGIRVADLNFQKGQLTVHRTPDDIVDIRLHQPQAKTKARVLPMSNALIQLCQEYIFKYRCKDLPYVRKNNVYLFVEIKNGKALTIGASNDIFRTITAKFPEIPKPLSAHILRHTWNDRFSEMADQKLLSGEWTAEDERKARCEWMGWVLDSTMAWHYSQRHIIKKAHNAGLELQKSILGDKNEQ